MDKPIHLPPQDTADCSSSPNASNLFPFVRATRIASVNCRNLPGNSYFSAKPTVFPHIRKGSRRLFAKGNRMFEHNIFSGGQTMSAFERPTEVSSVDGIANPVRAGVVTKLILAVALGRAARQEFGVGHATQERLAPYMNSVGSLTSDGLKDHDGFGYALFAERMLNGIPDPYQKEPDAWLRKNKDALDAARPFALAAVRILGSMPGHTPDHPANRILLESGRAKE